MPDEKKTPGSEETPSERSRPVPVAGLSWRSPTSPPPATPPETPAETAPPEPSSPSKPLAYREDVIVGAAAAVLAASSFLPWYRRGGFTASGWGTGTWGPLILFLALGSLALIVLRRRGVAVTLPVEEALVHQAVGWVSVIGLVLKSRMPITVTGVKLGVSWGIFVAVAAAFALIFVGGRMSPRAPIVLNPGWHRGTAGRIGLALIIVVVTAGVVFGATNSFEPRLGATGGGGTSQVRPGKPFPGQVVGRLPKCGAGFPVPAGVKPEQGVEGDQKAKPARPCIIQLSSVRTSAQVDRLYRDALKAAGWTFTVASQTKGITVLTLTGPRCGAFYIVPKPDTKSTIIAVTLMKCGAPAPHL